MALSTFTLLCMLMILNDTQINKATISFLSKLVCISVGLDGVGYALVTKAPVWSFFLVAEKKIKLSILLMLHVCCRSAGSSVPRHPHSGNQADGRDATWSISDCYWQREKSGRLCIGS